MVGRTPLFSFLNHLPHSQESGKSFCPMMIVRLYVYTDWFGTVPVRFSHRMGLLFTRDRSGTGLERIQNLTCKTAAPVLDPFWTGSRTTPCIKQKPIRSGPVRNGSGPVPCIRNLNCIVYYAETIVIIT